MPLTNGMRAVTLLLKVLWQQLFLERQTPGLPRREDKMLQAQSDGVFPRKEGSPGRGTDGLGVVALQ